MIGRFLTLSPTMPPLIAETTALSAEAAPPSTAVVAEEEKALDKINCRLDRQFDEETRAGRVQSGGVTDTAHLQLLFLGRQLLDFPD